MSLPGDCAGQTTTDARNAMAMKGLNARLATATGMFSTALIAPFAREQALFNASPVASRNRTATMNMNAAAMKSRHGARRRRAGNERA